MEDTARSITGKMYVTWLCLCALINAALLSVPTADGLPISPSNKAVSSSLDFAVESFNAFSEDDHLFKVGRILSSQYQDLGGMLYILDVELAETGCRKEAGEDLRQCPIMMGGSTVLCHFEVLDTFWRSQKSLLKSECAQRETSIEYLAGNLATAAQA
ncbi:asCystatin-like isoform X1 [Leucoraja erinacea]|uniref:asCystatin-like isoform X1 n=2 Tax=Leucoraja erinaceus TaxID=7782 RepID=UPI002455274F|nr:asCystatin-like isoform X1 [Leucoraja erinacea]